jgi:hypothetical protein
MHRVAQINIGSTNPETKMDLFLLFWARNPMRKSSSKNRRSSSSQKTLTLKRSLKDLEEEQRVTTFSDLS